LYQKFTLWQLAISAAGCAQLIMSNPLLKFQGNNSITLFGVNLYLIKGKTRLRGFCSLFCGATSLSLGGILQKSKPPFGG